MFLRVARRHRGFSHSAHCVGFSVDGVDGADQGRRGDHQRELPVELAGDAGHEARPAGTPHISTSVMPMIGPISSPIALIAASFGVMPVLDVLRHALHHHDRVVDHDADGEHEREQRQQVDA